MADPVRTAIDIGSVLAGPCRFEDELLTFAAGATAKPGTILARDSTTGKLVLFVKGGSTNGNGIPKAVLQEEVIATGAGDKPIRPVLGGLVNKRRLVIHADGNGTNIDAAVLDQLRAYGIEASTTTQLSALDN